MKSKFTSEKQDDGYLISDSEGNFVAKTSLEHGPLLAAAPELYKVVSSLEWLTKVVENDLVLACPRCTSIDGEHFPGCELEEVLKKARGEHE